MTIGVATYQENVQPVDLIIVYTQAIGEARITPPMHRIPKGHPARKRLRKGDIQKHVLAQNAADLESEEQLAGIPSRCGEVGHNRRTSCKRAPLE